ncbi:MAG: glycosyltransferase family 4 protein [Pseudomonadales bacterium]
MINIVCFKPDYLFGDLVERFVAAGCLHSDFPDANADVHIWMRPQELLHYSSLVKGKAHKETGARYLQAFKPPRKASLRRLVSRSVVIHHGTCHPPIYQFNHTHVAKALKHVNRVFGVCDFDSCYGPSASEANPDNFDLAPIGFDDRIFSEAMIRREDRPRDSQLVLGFVGRAYGQTDYKNSRIFSSHPLGYRKGGDTLLNTMLRLKALGVPCKAVVLGQRWDSLAEQFNQYGIEHDYHTRDTNISYKDYPAIFSEFDMLFIASRCEGGPVTALEALSMGVPVVSTNVGLLNHLRTVVPKEHCKLFDYDNKWGIADVEQAVQHLLTIANARTTLEQRKSIRASVADFTTENWVKKILGHCNSM